VREKLEQRLTELRAEYESGQRALAELEQKQMTLRDTVLGPGLGVEVLEEELGTKDRELPPG